MLIHIKQCLLKFTNGANPLFNIVSRKRWVLAASVPEFPHCAFVCTASAFPRILEAGCIAVAP